jgi:uncharacterized phage-like protein YoqJ
MQETTLKDKTCFFSGHRDILLEKYPEVQAKLEQTVEGLIDQGVQYFGAGGALGFDTLAALTILKLKRQHPEIRLALILPYKDYGSNWPDKVRKFAEQITNWADKVVYTSERYYNGCMYKRNRHMAEQSGWCVCYLERATGGTAYTVSYAKSVGVQIINLAE